MVQLYPEATVGALIVNEKGEVLLVHSKKWGEKYTVPGGHIELGEQAEDTDGQGGEGGNGLGFGGC